MSTITHPWPSNKALRDAVKSGALNPPSSEQPLWHMLGLKGKSKKYCLRLSNRQARMGISNLKGSRGNLVAKAAIETFGCDDV